MASRISKSRNSRYPCNSLDINVAHWMIPRSISVKRDSTCNVLVIVPYGYPSGDDNCELLGALLAEMLDCYAVINNRLYQRKGQAQHAGADGDLGNDTFARQIPKFVNPIINSLQSMRGDNPKIVIFLHGMDDNVADEFSGGLAFALGKGHVGKFKAKKQRCAASDLSDEFLAGLKQFGISTDDCESYKLPNQLAMWLHKDHGAQVFNVSIRCDGYRNSAEQVRQTSLALVEVIKGLTIFREWPLEDQNGNDVPPERHPEIQHDNEVQDKEIFVAPDGSEYEVGHPYTPSDPVEGASIRDKVESFRSAQETKIESEKTGSREGKMAEAEVVESVPERTKQADQTSAVIGKEALATIIANLKEQQQITNDKGKEVEFSGTVRETFVSDVEKSYPVVKAMVTNIFDTGKFFHEVRQRQKKNGLWIAFTDTIGLSRRTAHNYIQAYERLGTSMSQYSYLGVTKLLTVTRVKEPVAYLEKNADAIAKETTVEVRQRIAQETKRKATAQKRKKPAETVENMGYLTVKATLAANGRVLKVMGLNKELQEEILKLLKSHFSRKK